MPCAPCAMQLLISARVVSYVKYVQFPLKQGSMIFSCYTDAILICVFKNGYFPGYLENQLKYVVQLITSSEC